MRRPAYLFAISLLLIASVGLAQRRKPVVSAVPKDAKPHEVKVKPDFLTLRYKPQAGTLLYDIRTEIDQHVRTDRDELNGNLVSSAQLAFHNVSIDYKHGLWSFDQYFTEFEVAGRELSGDSLLLRETEAVNRRTRMMYEMKGNELNKTVLDTIRLFNAEAQTNAYFFEPPRLLIPLPEKSVTYGNKWSDHRMDTIAVRDTVNVGITTGEYLYDLNRTYSLARLLDTNEHYMAVIVAVDSGIFTGYQTNSVTNVSTKTHGPISGTDTTFLDLFSGRVVRRTLRMSIPTQVEISTAKPFTDFLEVYSVVALNESNATRLHNDAAVQKPAEEIKKENSEAPKPKDNPEASKPKDNPESPTTKLKPEH
jgi:hypothetical protein